MASRTWDAVAQRRHVALEIARSEANVGPSRPAGNLTRCRLWRFQEKLKAMLIERHIPYVVLVSPENRQVLEMIKASGSQWALERPARRPSYLSRRPRPFGFLGFCGRKLLEVRSATLFAASGRPDGSGGD